MSKDKNSLTIRTSIKVKTLEMSMRTPPADLNNLIFDHLLIL